MALPMAIENIIVEKAADALVEMERKDRYQDFYYGNILYEARFTAKLQSMFNDQRQEVLDKLEKVRLRMLDEQQRGIAPRNRAPYSPDAFMFDEAEWQLIFEEFGQLYFPEVIEGRGSEELRRLFVGVSFDVTDPRVEQFVKEKAYQFSFEVNRETVDKLRQTLAIGINRGEGIPDLTKRVNNVFDFNEKFRAKRIARTEVLKASNRGANEAYIQSGVVESKEWLNGPSPCPYCEALNGKTVAVDTNFFSKGDTIWGGELSRVLDYEDVGHPPIHPQCVCTIIPVLREVTVEKPEAERAREEIIELEKETRGRSEAIMEEVWQKEGEAHNLFERWKKSDSPLVKDDLYNQWVNMMEEIRKKRRTAKNIESRINSNIAKRLKVDPGKDKLELAQLLQGRYDIKPSTVESFRKKVKKAIREASDYVSGNVVKEKDITVVLRHKGYRASAGGKRISLDLKDDAKVIIHEIGHVLEDTNSDIRQKAQDFLAFRTKGEVAEWMGNGYRRDEIAKRDKFISPYVGKVYKTGATEVVSMGMQWFYHDPLTFAKSDPGHFDFIYNILRGL